MDAFIKLQAKNKGNANFGELSHVEAFLKQCGISTQNREIYKISMDYEGEKAPDSAKRAVDLFLSAKDRIIEAGLFQEENWPKIIEELDKATFLHWESSQVIIKN